MEDSSAAPDRFCSIREESGCVGDQTLQAHALKTCLEGTGGPEEAPAVAAPAGRMLFSRQQWVDVAGSC